MGIGMIEKLLEKEKELYVRLSKEEYRPAEFEGGYWRFLRPCAETLGYLVSGLAVSVAIKAFPKQKAEILQGYLKALGSRLESVIDYPKDRFFAKGNLLNDYKALEEYPLFMNLTASSFRRHLDLMRQIANYPAHASFHIHEELLRELLEKWQVKPVPFSFEDKIRIVSEKTRETLEAFAGVMTGAELSMKGSGPSLQMAGKEIPLTPLFIVATTEYPMEIKVFKQRKKNFEFTDGLNSEFKDDPEIGNYIEVNLYLETRDMHYLGEGLKATAILTAKDEKKPYTVRFTLEREYEEVFSQEIPWERHDLTVDISTGGMSEGSYTLRGTVIGNGKELACAWAKLNIQEKRPGKVEIRHIDQTAVKNGLLEHTRRDILLELENTGNTEIDFEAGLEGYDKNHLDLQPKRDTLQPYEDRKVPLTIRAIRTERKEYALGTAYVTIGQETIRQGPLEKVTIHKNYEPEKFLDRTDICEKARRAIKPENVKYGTTLSWIVGEAGQGKTRLMKRIEEIAKEEGNKCAVLNLEMQDNDLATFLYTVTRQSKNQLDSEIKVDTEILREEGGPKRAAIRLANGMCQKAQSLNRKLLIQIDDAHLLSSTPEGHDFVSELIRALQKEEEAPQYEVRLFFYTRTPVGLGRVDGHSLEPFTKIGSPIELSALKVGAKNDKEFEKTEDLVWGILTDVFDPHRFEDIEGDLRTYLAQVTEGIPLILQLLLERYVEEKAITWDEERGKWQVNQPLETLHTIFPKEKFKERLLTDKLESYEGEKEKIKHLVGMLGKIGPDDLRRHNIDEREARELEGRLLRKEGERYRYIHSLFAEYWEKEIGEKSLEDQRAITRVEELVKDGWGEKTVDKLWKRLELEGKKGPKRLAKKEELEAKLKEPLAKLSEDGYGKAKLLELYRSRKAYVTIRELALEGWRNRKEQALETSARYGYWLMGTTERYEEEGKEKDTAIEATAYCAQAVNNKAEKAPNVIYTLEFLRAGEYIVEKVFKKGKGRVPKQGLAIPKAYGTVGEATANRGRSEVAELYYQEALSGYDALARAHTESVEAHNGKGNMIRNLGKLYAGQGKHSEAEGAFRDALLSYNAAIARNPKREYPYANKGNVLTLLGELYEKQGKLSEAEGAFRDALLSCDAAIANAPESAFIYSNKGNALSLLGELYAKQGKHSEAEEAFRDALLSCDAAIVRNPERGKAYSNKGNALRNLGELYAERGKIHEAEGAFRDALLSCDAAIVRNSEYAGFYSNKGGALVNLGELLDKQGKHHEAERAFQDALVSFDAAIALNPENAKAYFNDGYAMLRLGELYAGQGKHHEAEESYRRSLDAYARAIDLTQGKILPHLYWKGKTHQAYARLLFDLKRPEEAEEQIDEDLQTQYQLGKLGL